MKCVFDNIIATKSADCVQNDVVAYIDTNRHRAPKNTVANKCEAIYSEEVIIDARKYLVEKVQGKLVDADPDLAKQAGINRRGSNNRTKAAVFILDIWNILEALEKEIKVIPLTTIELINPESLLPNSVGVRLNDIEKKLGEHVASIAALTLENEKLKETIEKLVAAGDAQVYSRGVSAAAVEVRDAQEQVGDLETEDSVADTQPSVVSEAPVPNDAASSLSVQSSNDEPIVATATVENTNNAATNDIPTATLQQSTAIPPAGDSTIARATTNSVKHKHQNKKGTNKHILNKMVTDIGIATALEAANRGLSKELAKDMGISAAASVAKVGYAGAVKQTAVSAATLPTPNGRGTTSAPPPHSTANNGNKGRKRLNNTAPYNRGTCDVNEDDMSLAYTKPQYLQNKALVISRIKRNITRNQFQQIVNTKADRSINFIHSERIDRTYSNWGTFVVELNDEDFALLSNKDFWPKDILIREWIGWRFWRSNTRVKPQEIKNSMRSQWAV